MKLLTLENAQKIADYALKYAHSHNLKPLSIVILDKGGNLKLALCDDNADLYRFDIARAKAKSALGMGFNTSELSKKFAANPEFFRSLNGIDGVNLIPSPGGVLIKTNDGGILGAIGISGDSGDNDENAAFHAIKEVFGG